MNDEELALLFAPAYVRRFQSLRDDGRRLVHYTSAEGAFRIITGPSIWLRNSMLMNDFSEIEHGLFCLKAAWDSPAGEVLRGLLNRHTDGLGKQVADVFDGHQPGIREATYIISLSEHEDEEDELGRLSMWRAYGGKAGVALVLNNTAFVNETQAMAAFSAPVEYLDRREFVNRFEVWANSLVANERRLREVEAERIFAMILFVFRVHALGTKHPGFREEREWRVFHSPSLDGQSPWLSALPKVLNGVPQTVYELSLFDDIDRGVRGVAPASLLNRVIVGPCDHPLAIRNALLDAMLAAKVDDAATKIWMSLIPLRQEAGR